MSQIFDLFRLPRRSEVRLGIPPEPILGYTALALRSAAATALTLGIALSGVTGCTNGTTDTPARGKYDPSEAPVVFGQRVNGASKPAAPGQNKTTQAAQSPQSDDSESPRSPAQPGSRAASAGEEPWSIVLATFRGENHASLAAAGLARVQSLAGFEAAYTATRGESTFIAFGRFGDPTEPAAQGELKRIRAAAISGERPFADAFLAPPPGQGGKGPGGAALGARPEYNLARARDQYGKGPLVTLQVGVYTRLDVQRLSPEDLAEIRRSAEEAAIQLRREGEQAYYFHGLRQSMVTIGVFPEEDVTAKQDLTKRNNPAAANLKKRFPYNLLNGAGYRTGSGPAPRSSEFVRVP